MINQGTKLRGRVDQASVDRVHGWAFDESEPDRQITVSVFLDDEKVGQVVADVLRPDLIAAGTFGSVGHGFEYRFNPPLDPGRPRRVTVRVLETGRLLDRGDRMVPDGTEPTAQDFGQTLPPAYPELPAPRTPREWFTLLGLLQDRQGLYNLIARCDFAGMRPDQVLYALFGDTEPPAVAQDEWDGGIARDAVYAALISPAFQKASRRLLLDAFPEKRRRFFIHVPKCAGTDLSAHLSVRFPAIHQSLISLDYTPRPRLFAELSRLCRLLPWFGTILVHGHMNLGEVLSTRLMRPFDEMFTTLRNPIDVALSQTNYILTRILQDAERGSFGPDSRTWLKDLGITASPAEVTRDVLDAHRLPLLRNAEINRADTLCEWLGGGSAREVIGRLEHLGAEVTTTRHYNTWLRDRWEIQSSTRRNESISFLKRDDLAPADLDYLHDITTEDRLLYAEVERRIDDTGASSVFMGR